jgi:hypothetical protein
MSLHSWLVQHQIVLPESKIPISVDLLAWIRGYLVSDKHCLGDRGVLVETCTADSTVAPCLQQIQNGASLDHVRSLVLHQVHQV